MVKESIYLDIDMKSSNEQIIRQLINAGDSQSSSPVRTPIMNTFNISEKSSTPSPSSKGAKWVSRLAKFQLSTGKKKKSRSQSPSPFAWDSPKLENTSSTNKLNSSSSSASSSPYPSRITSLPRPNSIIFQNNTRTISSFTDPGISRKVISSNVLPLEYPKVNSSNKKSFLNEVCALCDEPISNRTNGERIIELSCRHITHQECLVISFGNVTNYDTTDIYTLFPECIKCSSDHSKANRCIPVSDEIKDKLVSDFLINEKPTYGEPTRLEPALLTQLMSPLPSPIQQIERQSMYLNSNNLVLSTHSFKTNVPPPLCYRNEISGLNKPVLSNFSNTTNRPGSTIFASSSIVSSVDDQSSFISMETLSLLENIDESKGGVPIPLIRSFFTESLLNNFKETLSRWMCDDKFGLLRVVDKLLVSKDNSTYCDCECFLFENALLVASIKDELSINNSDVLGSNLENLQIFYLDEGIKIETIESSVLKLGFNSVQNSQEEVVYLTEQVNSASSKIIQKWISALLDLEILFNEINFTSTLSLPSVIQNLGNEDEKATFLGLITPTKVVEVARLENNRNSTIIRRGFQISAEHNCGTTIGTIQSVITSINSIISLKREIPEDILLVIQLDFDKLKDISYMQIYNCITALKSKYNSLKYCAVDSKGYVLKWGILSENTFDINTLHELKIQNSELPFSTRWLKDTIYPNNIECATGIVIVSNSTMEEDKSCLQMDYRKFVSPGRRKPNQMKIKVGYLNSDYSDKISELLEIGNWSFMLEALCYGFSLSFDDDDDDDYSDDDYYSDGHSMNSSALSVTTLLIGTPVNEIGNWHLNSGNEIERNNVIDPLQFHVPATPDHVEARSKTSRKFTGEKITKQVWEPLMNDIERAIEEIQDGTTE